MRRHAPRRWQVAGKRARPLQQPTPAPSTAVRPVGAVARREPRGLWAVGFGALLTRSASSLSQVMRPRGIVTWSGRLCHYWTKLVTWRPERVLIESWVTSWQRGAHITPFIYFFFFFAKVFIKLLLDIFSLLMSSFIAIVETILLNKYISHLPKIFLYYLKMNLKKNVCCRMKNIFPIYVAFAQK